MAQTSFALLTNAGRAKEAAALANGSTIEITHIAIGDGATVPSGGETALYNEVARRTISGHGTVTGAENVAYFDAYLAAGDGPYTIREAGLYDSEGDLIAIAHYDPPISKPVPASGQTVEGTVRIEVAFSNIATVVIKVDPSMQVALQRLTQLPWVAVMELGRNDPPAAPVPGDIYVIGAAPTGTWVGHAGKVAEYTIAGWALLAPRDGHGIGLPNGEVYRRVAGVYEPLKATQQQVDDGVVNNVFITPAQLTKQVPSYMAARSGSTTVPSEIWTNLSGYGVVSTHFRGASTFAAGVITVGEGDEGSWLLTLTGMRGGLGTSGFAVRITINDVTFAWSGGQTSLNAVMNASASVGAVLAVGDVVKFQLIQTTGGPVEFLDYALSAMRLGGA